MNLWRTLKLAAEGLTLNKVRSFLTTLGVIIGVAAVIIMLAISSGAEAEIADQINALGPNLIMVMPTFTRGGFGRRAGGGFGFPYEDIDAIAQGMTGINGVAAEQSTMQNVSNGSSLLESVAIVGTTVGFENVREYHVAEGRFLTAEDLASSAKVAVLGAGVAEELFGGQNPIGQRIKLGSTRATVVGVMEKKGVVGNTDFDARVYIPLTVVFDRFMRQRFGGERVNTIYVSAESRHLLDSVMMQLTSLLSQRHGVDPSAPDFQLLTQDSIITTAASTTATFRNLLAWVAAVSLVVGGIGIMNIMLVSVTERTREIGLRQALGARSRDVELQFLLEAVALSMLGGLLGVLAGVAGAYVVNGVSSMRADVVPASIPLAFLAAAAVGVFFGYYPATKAAQLDPIVALRHE